MFVSYLDCNFVLDDTSPEAAARGDGDLSIHVSALGLAHGEAPPAWVDLERAPGVVARFEYCGPVFVVDSAAGTPEELVGWSYWEDEASEVPGVTPCIDFMVLAG